MWKIGAYYINTSQIKYIAWGRDRVEVYLILSEMPITFEGEDYKALKFFLENVSTNVIQNVNEYYKNKDEILKYQEKIKEEMRKK